MNKFIDLTLIAILTAAILAFAWVGFIAADDRASSEAAMRWLTDGFYVGDTVWALRHPHVLGIAASYALFGFGEFQLILPAIIYLLLILVAVYVFLNRFAGRRAALAACVLLVLTPLMISQKLFLYFCRFSCFGGRRKAPRLFVFCFVRGSPLVWAG